jgi:hypothetical protein
MNHGEFSRYEKALEKAAKILESAELGEPVTLVLMSNHPKILLRSASYDPDEIDELLKEQTTASPYRLSLEHNLEQLEELVADLKTPARECYLITDSQELDWGELSDTAQDTLVRLTREANVFVVPIDVDGEDNLSLTELTYASGSLRLSGDDVRFLAKVRNEGRNSIDGGSVEFFVGAGDIQLRARLAKDELIDDNDRYAVVNIRPSISVLCVDDQPSGGAGESRRGKYYAMRALRGLGHGEEETLHVHHVEASNLSPADLLDCDVLLMANVADMKADMIKEIDRFVRGGRGLILFLGDQVDAKVYNEQFGTGPKGLLPGELGAVLAVEEGQVGWSLRPTRSQHPLAQIVSRLTDGLADSTRFSKVMQVTPSPQSETILTITGQNAPLLLSRDVGDGSVLMFTTSADRSWNELAIHPLYTMLLQQAVTNMTSHPEASQRIVGETTELAVRGRKVGDRATVTDPAKQVTELKVTQVRKRPVCVVETETVGVYHIAADQDAPAVTVAANVDPAESNVRVVDAAALANKLEPLGVRVVSKADALGDAIEEGRQGRELAGFLLACGLIVFILQSLLAKYFTNRMSQPETDVAASLQMSRVSAARRS